MSMTVVACSLAYGKIQVLSDHVLPFFFVKPGTNVDSEDASNLLEYSELFCTPLIEEVIAIKITGMPKNF
jgi:hypothetical protein